jgi:hypothetical protein
MKSPTADLIKLEIEDDMDSEDEDEHREQFAEHYFWLYKRNWSTH